MFVKNSVIFQQSERGVVFRKISFLEANHDPYLNWN